MLFLPSVIPCISDFSSIMSDVEIPVSPSSAVDASPKANTPKTKKSNAPKKPADHPKFTVMVTAAVEDLKERGGSSRQAIVKYIMKNYNVGDNTTAVNSRVKTALKAGVKTGTLKQAKGTGATGSFKIGEKPKAEKKPKKQVVKKPKSPVKKATKKPTTPKKATKKPAEKKAAVKKTAAKKASPKKAKKTVAKKSVAAKKEVSCCKKEVSCCKKEAS